MSNQSTIRVACVSVEISENNSDRMNGIHNLIHYVKMCYVCMSGASEHITS